MSNPLFTTRHVQTSRLNTYLREGGDPNGFPLILVHGNVSSGAFFEELLQNVPAGYRLLVPDLRGFGESETKPVDATRGVCDWSDDLHSLTTTLDLQGPIALGGWSLGGGVVMQYLLDHPAMVSHLILLAPVSPYGFGGTRDTTGTLTTPDAAGSGGGCANAEFVKLLAANDMGSASQLAPRHVMNAFYFKPPFQVAAEQEDRFVAAMNQTATGEANYPGDLRPAEHWPMVAPGDRGVLNTIAPTHFNVSAITTVDPKPQILWVRGADDQIVSDSSFFDLAFLGQVGAVPGWPGADACPPQPMIGQTRAVLEQFKANGGTYEEVVYADCGHSPHIEKAAEFQQALWAFLA